MRRSTPAIRTRLSPSATRLSKSTPCSRRSGAPTYQGHEGARRWLGEIVEAWTEFHVVVEATFDLGEQTLAFVVLHGRGSVSGAEVVMPYAQVMRWREGRSVWFKAYAHREDALSDLEVSEDT